MTTNTTFLKPPYNNPDNFPGLYSLNKITRETNKILEVLKSDKLSQQEILVIQKQYTLYGQLRNYRKDFDNKIKEKIELEENFEKIKNKKGFDKAVILGALEKAKAEKDKEVNDIYQNFIKVNQAIGQLESNIKDTQGKIEENEPAVNQVYLNINNPATAMGPLAQPVVPESSTTTTESAYSSVSSTESPFTINRMGKKEFDEAMASVEHGNPALAAIAAAREAYIKESRIENMYEGNFAVKLKRETKLRAFESQYNKLKNEYVMSLQDPQAQLEFLMGERRSCNDTRFKNGIEEKKSFKDKISNALGGITGMFNKHGYLARGLYSAATGNIVGAAMSGAMGNEFVNNKIKSFGLVVNKGLGKFMSQETADRVSPFITRAALGMATAGTTALLVGGMVSGGAIAGAGAMALAAGLGTAVVAEGADYAMRKTILQDHKVEDIAKKLNGSLEGIAAAEKMIKEADTGNNKKIRSFVATTLGLMGGAAAGANIHEGLVNVNECDIAAVAATAENTVAAAVVEDTPETPVQKTESVSTVVDNKATHSTYLDSPELDNIVEPVNKIPDIGSPELDNITPLPPKTEYQLEPKAAEPHIVELKNYPEYETPKIEETRDDVYDKPEPAQDKPRHDGSFWRGVGNVFGQVFGGATIEIGVGGDNDQQDHDRSDNDGKPQMQRTDDTKTPPVDKPVRTPQMQGTGVKGK